MLTNRFKVVPDLKGTLLQRYAAQIVALDPHADCPSDPKAARVMLAELEQRQARRKESGQELRLSQIHEIHNRLLPQLAKAKRLGVRSRNDTSPGIPDGGQVTPDDLRVMTEFAQQLDIDIEEFEALTPDQRRIAKLEARIADVVAAHNKLVAECNKHEDRIAALEAQLIQVAA